MASSYPDVVALTVIVKTSFSYAGLIAVVALFRH